MARKLIITNKFWILLFAIFYAPKILCAADKPLIAIEEEKKPLANQEFVTTKIRSKFITVKRKSGIVEFKDNVITEREDTSFLADRMMVYYDEKENNKTNDQGAIKKIEAFGHVKIFNEEIIATGQTGFYDPSAGIFIVEGDVVFNNGTSLANGSKFVYNINTKKGDLFGQNPEPKNDNEASESKDNRVLVIIGDDLKKDKNTKDQNKQENIPNEENIKR